jgi:predicted O-linked N-acetylglucosamine transferase (SPINDLY family)
MEHFERIAGFDVALDTFPFTGCTTTFEALSMGVPVVTLAGERYASRMSGSLLSGLGLTDLIAVTSDDYVGKVVGISGDVGRRAELRATLRQRIAASPLCDAAAYGRAMAAAYRRMWRRWCQQQGR